MEKVIKTDYEKLKQCFDEIGIEYRDVIFGCGSYIQILSIFDNSIIQINFDEFGKYTEMQ